MRWVNFIVIVQAVLIFLFVIVYLFQWTFDYRQSDPFENSSVWSGNLPSSQNNADMGRLAKGALILLVVSIIELIIISKTFK
jgi:ABC-type phosphate transport system permease subunit